MRAPLSLVAATLLSACAFASGSSQSIIENEVIYRMEGAGVLEVYNLERLWVGDVGPGYLKRRDGRYGEFGGSFEICSTDEYFCLTGAIAAAIPKNFSGQTAWQFAGQSCSASSPLVEGQVAIITCTRGNWSNDLTFSQSRGILSYTKAVHPDEHFMVVGEKGLFAQRHSEASGIRNRTN